ncbi:MAG: alpha/beta hydrolase [Gordonia sp. (in: high G+C Gram-positive bacteria)]|uniref:alpha/beta hydrolase n=1 Tax=Gordonia sp. (in: high G+C Gram-positive bacteria) TaxID=84139 RepID=UPI0039E2EEA3
MTATATNIKNVTFRNPDMYWDIAADLYLPEGFDESKKYPTVITAHPIGSCKEQTAGNIYASRLAAEGFVAIAFDASFQGRSGGEPRRLEDPTQRVEDFRRVVDYLVTLPYVDADRIGALGVCGGGGYVLNAGQTEKRIKAVVGVTAVNYGRMMRDTAAAQGGPIALLNQVAAQRTAEVTGADQLVNGMLPPTAEGAREVGDIDIIEAFDYYCTPRGESENGSVNFDIAHGSAALGWDAFHLADVLFDQPVRVFVGDKKGAFGAYDDGHAFIEKAASTDKKITVIPGASHYDLYDRPNGAGVALEEIVPFFTEKL